MANVIEIEHLTYSYPGASQPTLKDITIQIEKGDFLAIVGNNGCGKSTFCKTLNGLIPQFISGDFDGTVLVCGLDTKQTEVGRLAQKVGYVYQDFENQIIRPTVLDDVSYACLNYAMPDYLERGKKALEQCGLTGKEHDYIWQLSGGQTHLLALAGAVSLQPEVLILDEPIAQLDPMHADKIYAVLRELNEKYGKTIIVIEHHTEYIADFCKHVTLMKDGQIQWTLPAREVLCRVDELQSCNIFPPQVTIAAHRTLAARQPEKAAPLPTTVEEGKEFFVPKSDRAPEKAAAPSGQGKAAANRPGRPHAPCRRQRGAGRPDPDPTGRSGPPVRLFQGFLGRTGDPGLWEGDRFYHPAVYRTALSRKGTAGGYPSVCLPRRGKRVSLYERACRGCGRTGHCALCANGCGSGRKPGCGTKAEGAV